MPGHSVDIPRCPYLCRPNHPLVVRTLYLPSEPFTCRPNPLPSVRTIHPLAVRTLHLSSGPSLHLQTGALDGKQGPQKSSHLPQ